MELLKTLWYIRKVRVYEALIIKISKACEKLRAKQVKYTERSEHYRKLVQDSTTIK